jgi:hypothetical protein
MQIPRRLALSVSGLVIAAGSIFGVGAATPASAATTTVATTTAAPQTAVISGYHRFHRRGHHYRFYGGHHFHRFHWRGYY